jgi:hypothetical protein
MAAAAAQVQASLRAKHSKQLDEEREEGKLNVHQRKNILKELELHRNTRFLSDLCAGKALSSIHTQMRGEKCKGSYTVLKFLYARSKTLRQSQ